MGMAEIPSKKGNESEEVKRDGKGRFLPGNPGGPGNPHGTKVHAWRAALADSITPDDIREIMGVLLAAGKAGKPWAVKELLDRCLGKPTVAVSLTDETRAAMKTYILTQEEVERVVGNGKEEDDEDSE